MSPDTARLPRATYRVQLHKGFTFDDAAAIVPYLHELGITHLYCSPYLQARPGSQHGYDVVNHSSLNEELGGSQGHRRMVDALARNGLGHVLDIVPNHMAISDARNRWWWDVLRNGAQSPYAAYFDIDWDPPEGRLKRQILLPILGDHYGRVLDSGELKLERVGEELVVRYHEHIAPVAPGTAPDDADLDDPEVLHAVLEQQHYRLAYWKAAGADLNYRRFFSINDLAALRIENDQVFDSTHALVLELVDEGVIDGLRIDHVDGLRYPAAYLGRLRGRAPDIGIWVEKILAFGEELPNWPVEGTTGYEFAAHLHHLFLHPEGAAPLSDLYESLTGLSSLEDMTYEAKLHAMNTELAPDIERLTELFLAICEKHRDYRDFTRPLLRQTLRETIAAFTVYRTYCDGRTGEVSEIDAARIRAAIAAARARRGDLDPDLFSFLEELLLLRHTGSEEIGLAMRFQQTTGPIMAKAVEDTLFYRYNRFVASNEVGGEPGHFGLSLDEWHAYNERVARDHPHTLLTTSTHDTKRSEDVRARLTSIAEIPDRWRALVIGWLGRHERYRAGDLPDRNTEYLLYQTLIGAWPIDADRATAYMEKATKEAKVHTSWIAPSETFDSAVAAFTRRVLEDPDTSREVGALVTEIERAGRAVSLAQTLLKLTCPGIPDFYQGTDTWDLSLVDPDNRRPVDYEERRAALRSDHPKTHLIRTGLHVRARYPEAFARGSYVPLRATGSAAEHVVAHARAESVVAVAARFPLSRPEGWGDTAIALPVGPWTEELTGRSFDGVVPMSELLGDGSVALLTRADR